MHTKQTLYAAGLAQVQRTATANSIVPPTVRIVHRVPGTCAYYRNGRISISVAHCAPPAPSALCRLWSYPGYKIDRTPYGVLLHELGHHVDAQMHYVSTARLWRAACAGSRVSGYEPNDSEKFAESFRLFASNPQLLHMVAPNRHAHLVEVCGLVSVAPATWRAALAQFNAPARFVAAANKFA